MKVAYIIAVATAVSLAGCQEIKPTVAPQTMSFLSEQELLATIPGATLYGTSTEDNRTQWVQAYSNGGRSGIISGRWGEEPYTSTWYVKDNMWCEKSNAFHSCFMAKREGQNALRMFRDGTEKLENLWYIK